jgi:hypothetical protein
MTQCHKFVYSYSSYACCPGEIYFQNEKFVISYYNKDIRNKAVQKIIKIMDLSLINTLINE